MKVLILAGGKATRNNKYINNCYPKYMITLGNKLFLDELINFWTNEKKIKDIYIVLNNYHFINQTRCYINEFYPKASKNIHLLYYEKTDGTFKTLYNISLRDSSFLKDTIISWADIIPETINLDLCNKVTVFKDDYSLNCRYLIQNIYNEEEKSHEIQIQQQSDYNGNVIGLYHIKDFDIKHFIEYDRKTRHLEKEIDFVDFLSYGLQEKFFNISLKNIKATDIGDIKKYETYIDQNSIQQRWFNDIVFEKYVTKTANSDYGRDVMKDEIGFYDKIIKYENYDRIVPKVKEIIKDGIIIENLKPYKTVHELLKNYEGDNDFAKTVYYSFTKNITFLHNLSNVISIDFKHFMFNDILDEYFIKIYERLYKIRYLIPQDIRKVNGYEIDRFEIIMENLINHIYNKKYQMGIIHGDPNTTNVMVHNDDYYRMKFIDPRGKFGNSKLIGDLDYDFAKFLYGLSGYDDFNLDKDFTFKLNNNEINFDIKGYDLDQLTDNNDLKILVGIIWLKLPYYIKNNINKVIASYYQGLKVLTKYL